MKTDFRVAAIVPTLDRPADLEACLRSLSAMNPGPVEVVVADQGTASLGSLLGWLDPSRGIQYLHLAQRGLSRARNAALAIVSAPWLWFPDDDATAEPDLLARMSAALARTPDAGFLAARVITPAGSSVMKGMDEPERPLRDPADVLATVMSPGLFVAARVIERVGNFDETFGVGAEWPSGEESDLLFRAFAAGETGLYVPGAVVHHPDPFAIRDDNARRRRARAYGRGWGALFAKHAAGPNGGTFAAMQRRFETRALGGALLSMLTLRSERARLYRESWLGRREGWNGWRRSHGKAR